MDNIKKLEEIGLEKVSSETHIEKKYLKYMVDNCYEELDRINTLGFIKILSREYGIDLDAWTKEFEEYWKQNRDDGENSGLFIVADDTKKSKKLLIFTLFALFGVIFTTLFFVTSQQNTLFENMNEKNNTLQYNDDHSLKTTISQDSMVNEDEDEVQNDTEQNEVEEEYIDENITVEIPQEMSEENIQIELDANTSNVTLREIDQSPPKEIIISPNLEIWVGVVYLDTKKKASLTKSNPFNLDIARDQILTTGHGNFNLIDGEKTKKFRSKSSLKFLIKDSIITQISVRKFNSINGGKPW